MKVIQLNSLPTGRADQYVEPIGKLFHAAWKDCEPDYATEYVAILDVARRVAVEPLFVAIDNDGQLAGVATIPPDDYYPGFRAENGVAHGYIASDLVVVERYRGKRFGGLKVWEHLLREVLQWVSSQGDNCVVVFADKQDPRVSLFARSGARYVRDVVHRKSPARCIAMLEYNVESTLASLDARLTACCW